MYYYYLFIYTKWMRLLILHSELFAYFMHKAVHLKELTSKYLYFLPKLITFSLNWLGDCFVGENTTQKQKHLNAITHLARDVDCRNKIGLWWRLALRHYWGIPQYLQILYWISLVRKTLWFSVLKHECNHFLLSCGLVCFITFIPFRAGS